MENTFTTKMKKLVIYVHGKGGNAAEANHYAPLFPDCYVVGFDYKSETPWDAETEFGEYYEKISKGFDSVILVANSIGAYFSICSLNGKGIEKAYFISPVVNMETLIYGMMSSEGVSEKELEIKKEIPTALGEPLSWDYLSYAKTHPAAWKAPTHILYGENDILQSFETINGFAKTVCATVTVMKNGEHWFHTEEQMRLLDEWIAKNGK